jgi:cytochrome c oxidase subunit 2
MTDTTDAGSSGQAPMGVDESQLSMGIDPYERGWMILSVGLLVAFLATVTIAGFFLGFQVNGEDAEVDPRTVLDSEPWSNPGLRKISDGKYEAWVIAQTWAFVPRELEIPVGSEVKINITSPDLQHGLKITDTNVNVMVVPGQVSTVTYTFDEVGEFPYICHEYCGTGHVAMWGVVNVVPATQVDDAEEAGQ